MRALEKSQVDLISAIAIALPELQTTIRYYDDFEEKHHAIRNLANADVWTLRSDGISQTIDFSKADVRLRNIYKHLAVDLVSRLDPHGAVGICSWLLNCPDHFLQALVSTPPDFRRIWTTDILPNSSWNDTNRLRTAIHALCNLGIGHWRPDMNSYVSQFESPPRDIYKTVRTGDCFLPLGHQSLLIEYIDELVAAISSNSSEVSTGRLRDASVLVISHQYGFRPGQIARIKTADMKCHDNGAVHIAIPLLKQRGSEAMRRVTRRIKHEWCPVFIEYTKRVADIDKPSRLPHGSYFQLTPREVTTVVCDLTENITGTRWWPTDLRHTAAQRLADAGVSHISLSEFMGHATTLTANVYFDASPTQAQRINQALALSPIYSNVVEVARTRTIDKAALLRLPSDQQIGGVPHGIPIAGIGGCAAGQSLCAKNPILSCYTCRKFMPLADAQIHDAVVESLRPVVTDFANASRRNEESPAYTQLRRMLDAAQQVAHEIRMAHAPEGDRSP